MPNSPNADPPRAARMRSRICMIGVAVIFGYLLIYHYHHQNRGTGNGAHLNDFPTFYYAAQCVREHRDIYSAGTSMDMMYVYPPLIAFVFTPLTFLSLAHAGQVGLLFNTLMLFGSIMLAARCILRRLAMPISLALWPVALAASLLSFPAMRVQLTMGETDAIMLFMFALAFYWLDSRPVQAGLALAVALNIKYLSIVAIPWFILRRRWTALIAMLMGAVLIALLPATLLGWHENLRCLHVALGGLLTWVGVPPEQSGGIEIHNIAATMSVSATSSIARILGPRGYSNPAIMKVATGAGVLSLGLVMGMYRLHRLRLWRWPAKFRQIDQPFNGLIALEWPGLVTAALVFSPDTNTRHLVMAVLVNTLAAALVLVPRPPIRRAPAVVGTVLIFLSYIMPFGRASAAMHDFYYTYSIPGWGLLAGYLLILWTGLGCVAAPSLHVLRHGATLQS